MHTASINGCGFSLERLKLHVLGEASLSASLSHGQDVKTVTTLDPQRTADLSSLCGSLQSHEHTYAHLPYLTLPYLTLPYLTFTLCLCVACFSAVPVRSQST